MKRQMMIGLIGLVLCGCTSNTNGLPYVNSLTDVTDLGNTWSGCTQNKDFPSVSNLTNVTGMNTAYGSCSKLTNNIADLLQPVAWFSTGKCKNFGSLFFACNDLNGSAMPYVNAIMSAPGYPTGYTHTQMFYNCTNLTDYASIPAGFK